MKRKPATKGMPLAQYQEMLRISFRTGANGKTLSKAADQHPLKRYPRIAQLAASFPDDDSLKALSCSYAAGALAASLVGQKSEVDEAEMKQACDVMQKLAARYLDGRGPVCRSGSGT
jgi:hypothetical protein